MLDGLIAVLLALAALVALTGGVSVDLGSFSLTSHSAARVLAVAMLPIGLRLMWGRRQVARDTADGDSGPAVTLLRIALLTLIALSIGYWFKYLLTSVGGADSYGYASAGRLLASGQLIDPAPIADWLSSPNRLALASPLGWAPSPAGDGIVPTYPLGLPALMAIAGSSAGTNAIYFISPMMGLLTLWLVFRLTRSWKNQQTALLATALVAWNPVFLTYVKQPMSDVPATAWMMIALYSALSPTTSTPRNLGGIVAGVAAGAALLTRPALILAAGLVPLLALRGPNAYQRLLLAGTGVAAAVIVQLALQAYLFGSPLVSGYGSAEALFSWPALPQNVDIYLRQSGRALGGPWLLALGIGMWALRGQRTVAIVAVAAAVTLPYLFYIRFDHWETLRFLLPGLVPLSILAAAGVTLLTAKLRVPAVASIVILGFAAAFAARSERLMRESSVWDIPSIEARYALAGQWLNVNTAPQSVALAHQHSGSLRWYGGRQTLRWDLMGPGELVSTVRELEDRGVTVYAALEGLEQALFETKFAGALADLTVDPVGRVRNVSFVRLRTR